MKWIYWKVKNVSRSPPGSVLWTLCFCFSSFCMLLFTCFRWRVLFIMTLTLLLLWLIINIIINLIILIIIINKLVYFSLDVSSVSRPSDAAPRCLGGGGVGVEPLPAGEAIYLPGSGGKLPPHAWKSVNTWEAPPALLTLFIRWAAANNTRWNFLFSQQQKSENTKKQLLLKLCWMSPLFQLRGQLSQIVPAEVAGTWTRTPPQTPPQPCDNVGALRCCDPQRWPAVLWGGISLDSGAKRS